MSWIIVDDWDTSFEKTSGTFWKGPFKDQIEYQNTVTGWDAGSVWNFDWVGADIQVLGSVAFGGGGNATFTVDSQAPVQFQAPVEDLDNRAHHQLFKAERLQDGSHSLSVTTGLNDKKRNMYYDYILYKATPQTVISEDTTYFLDDSTLTFDGKSSSQGLSANMFNRTSTITSEGTTFTLKWFGTSISVHGALMRSDAPYKASASSGGATVGFAAPAGPGTQWNRQLMKIENLAQNQEHTLTFTSQSAGLVVDYVLVNPGAGGSILATTGNSNGTPSGAPLPSGSAVSVGRATPIAAIVGGTAAGVIITILIALAVLFCMRRGRKRQSDGPETGQARSSRSPFAPSHSSTPSTTNLLGHHSGDSVHDINPFVLESTTHVSGHMGASSGVREKWRQLNPAHEAPTESSQDFSSSSRSQSGGTYDAPLSSQRTSVIDPRRASSTSTAPPAYGR